MSGWKVQWLLRVRINMASLYSIAVIEKESGKVVASWEPGLKEEQDFIPHLCARAKKSNFGLMLTTASLITAFQEMLLELKSKV